MTGKKFYVVQVDEGKPATITEIGTLDGLKTFLQTHCSEEKVGLHRQVFILQGQRWLVTPGVFRYLVPPQGCDPPQHLVPITLTPLPQAADPDGWVDSDSVGGIDADPEYTQVTKEVLPPPALNLDSAAKASTQVVDEEGDSPFDDE